MAERAYLALGSNLGDRRAALDGAVAALRAAAGIQVVAVSSYHETKPVGGPPGQSDYLNAAVAVDTTLAPDALLAVLLEIEKRFGRIRGEVNAPRTLDIDLLLYGDQVRERPDPVVPHPRMHQRRFVLEPLAEIACDVRHPGMGVRIGGLRDHLRGAATAARPLMGLNALVTGGTSGIGRAIAETLAEAGAWLIIHGRSEARASETVEKLKSSFDVFADYVLADLTDANAVLRLAESAWHSERPLDILVCNAGADTLTGEAARWSFERKLQELWSVDVWATIQLARSVGAKMKQRGRGVILTMGWDQAESGMEGDSGQLFAASKGAVMAFTRSLARTLAPEVRVNCLAPGWIKTAWGAGASDVWQNRVLRETPMARWGTPEDVARTARWLCSPEASYVTGQIVRVNGGAVM